MIFNHFGGNNSNTIVCLYLKVGFDFGVHPGQFLDKIEYEEEAKGYFHLTENSIKDLNNAQEQRETLNEIHPTKGWEDETFFSDQIANWDAWIEAFQTVKKYKTGKQDTQPDEFYFNAGGYSGRFSYNLDGTPVIFPYQEGLEITKYHENGTAGDIVGFKIKTPDGKEYDFGDIDGGQEPNAVDFTENTNYYLPNFYTYPEIDTARNTFGQAQIDVGQLSYFSFFGFRRVHTYGNTYERNYKKMKAPKFSSSWHLVNIKSHLTQEEVSLHYTKRDSLTYYSDKSFTHSFPNFAINTNNNFATTKNNELNPFHINPSKWENGRAEFAYSATETSLDRWDLSEIRTNRGESAFFYYGTDRGEIYGDKLCDSILIKRGDNQVPFKGWLLDYDTIVSPGAGTAICHDVTDTIQGVQTEMPNDALFYLGSLYEMDQHDYHNYIQISIRLGCIALPFRLNLPYGAFRKNWGYTDTLGMFGSLMDVKRRLYSFNKSKEEAIYKAEHTRSFLKKIIEIDKDLGLHDDFVHMYYNEGTLPNRFSLDQDLLGYHNDNSTGSPLPPIQYTDIDEGDVKSTDEGTEKHFAFYNISTPTTFHEGHDYDGEFDKAKIGALKFLKYGSGGEISYTYESNILPYEGSSINGAGIRVLTLIENPADENADPKITKYKYGTPKVINDPIRIEHNPVDIYYPSLETKVVCSSSILNPLFQNKNNHVGYQEVHERWDGIGYVAHHFTTPYDFETFIRPEENDIDTRRYIEHKKGILTNPDFESFYVLSDMPPGLEFPTKMQHISEFMGLEYKTEVFGASGLVNQIDNEFEYYGTDCSCDSTATLHNEGIAREDSTSCKPSLVYYQSQRYQYNYPGSFWDNYLYRLVANYQPFYNLTPIDDLLNFLVGLIIEGGTSFEHDFKYIDRHTYVSERCIRSGNVRMAKSTSVNYFADGTINSDTTSYTYDANEIRLPNIPLSTLRATSDNHQVVQFNLFDGDTHTGLGYYDQAALDLLDTIKYQLPLFSETRQNGTLIQNEITALTTQQVPGQSDYRVVPKSNYTARNDTLVLAGVFQGYNDDGKPLKYYLAKHKATENDNLTDTIKFFDPISFTWNNQLQLTSRTYKDFTSSYSYDNTYYVLKSQSDPDAISTLYGYDPRWRMDSLTTLNGRQVTEYAYSIAEGNNYVKTIVSFADGSFPSQENTQFSDGFGRPTILNRDNDGVTLSRKTYDHYFRLESAYAIGQGKTEFSYDASPITREQTAVDAVGNITKTVNTGDNSYFAKTKVTDPNFHTLTTKMDGLGRTRERISEEGGVTKYSYDDLNRLTGILNPELESYSYSYNDIGTLYSKKIPGAAAQTIWWDYAFRPIAISDGLSTRIMKYDDYNRITEIYKTKQTLTADETKAQAEDVFDNDLTQILLTNYYEPDHTWLDSLKENILENSGISSDQKVTVFSRDDIGRATGLDISYPVGHVASTIGHTDAGVVTGDVNTVTGPLGNQYTYSHTYDFDNILRPEKTSVDYDSSGVQMLNKLFYNNADQVVTKYVGGKENNPLQKVDYRYDAIGRLTHINDIAEMACFRDEEFCTMHDTLNIDFKDPSSCQYLEAIEIDSTVYDLGQVVDLLVNPNFVQTALEEALDALGFIGEVSIDVDYISETHIIIYVTVAHTNASEIKLHFYDCAKADAMDVEYCCENESEVVLPNEGLDSNYVDLYYQLIEYTGIDINRIEISSDCSVGFMRNDYTYDGDHRITTMENTFFNPSPIPDLYNTSYTYGDAGSLTSLTRKGLIDENGGNPIYGFIDSLTYSYANERLDTITDGIVDSLAQSKGFKPALSKYSYDGNGNVTFDSGKDLSIGYNLLNLPKAVSNSGGDYINYDYAFGGEKLKKESKDSSITETRRYIGGIEFVDNEPEFFSHAEGRIVIKDSVTLAYQFRLTDHLGNTVVLFEDKDSSGVISTEIPANPEEAEVLQRNLYYPFGLAMEGTWDDVTDPRHDYLYNGKELQEELGLNWLSYGAREYDPAIGRFQSVDPLAEKMAPWSTFAYTFNNPLLFIDPIGAEPAPPTDYYYDANGNLVGTVENNLPDRHFVQMDGGNYTFNGEQYSQINSLNTIKGDPKSQNPWNCSTESLCLDDIQAIITPGVEHVKENYILNDKGIYKESQEQGMLDYVNLFEDGTIYEIQGIYYNSHEALNLFWGAALSQLNVSPTKAIIAAEYYHNNQFRKGNPRYQRAGASNEPNHNTAIYMGYNVFDNWAGNDTYLSRYGPKLYFQYTLFAKLPSAGVRDARFYNFDNWGLTVFNKSSVWDKRINF